MGDGLKAPNHLASFQNSGISLSALMKFNMANFDVLHKVAKAKSSGECRQINED